MSAKKNILFLNASWLVGGVERVISTLAGGMADTYNIYICVYGEVANAIYKTDPRIKFIFAKKKKISEVIRNIIQTHSIDIVIGNSGIADECFFIYREIKKTDAKLIVCTHENYFYPHSSKYHVHNTGERVRTLKCCDRAVFLTNYSLAAYNCFNNNGVCIHNPLSEEVALDFVDNINGSNIVAVGRWNDPIKRIDQLILVFAELLKNITDAMLYIVGPYSLNMKCPGHKDRTVAELIVELKIPNRQIIFTGEKKEVAQYFRLANINLVTSDSEGFSMVIVEAAASGTPSVIYDIPGLDDIIIDGENGFIVEQYNYKEMAKKIEQILMNKAMQGKMRQSAFRLAHRFEKSYILKQWDEVFATVFINKQPIYKEKMRKFKIEDYYDYKFCQKISKEYQNSIDSLVCELDILKKSWIYRINLWFWENFSKIWRILKLIRLKIKDNTINKFTNKG